MALEWRTEMSPEWKVVDRTHLAISVGEQVENLIKTLQRHSGADGFRVVISVADHPAPIYNEYRLASD